MTTLRRITLPHKDFERIVILRVCASGWRTWSDIDATGMAQGIAINPSSVRVLVDKEYLQEHRTYNESEFRTTAAGNAFLDAFKSLTIAATDLAGKGARA
jgi:hypothetical protein